MFEPPTNGIEKHRNGTAFPDLLDDLRRSNRLSFFIAILVWFFVALLMLFVPSIERRQFGSRLASITQNSLATLWVLGTFTGIPIGLLDFDEDRIDESVTMVSMDQPAFAQDSPVRVHIATITVPLSATPSRPA